MADRTGYRAAMRTSTADGRQLAWEEYGDPAGPPVFLFHGTPGSRFDSDPFGSPIGARIITPDRPGYGESSPHPTRRLVDWPGDVCTIADHLGIDRFHVVGISGGGPHALVCAALLPHRVISAATVCGVGPLDWEGADEGMMPSNVAANEAARTNHEMMFAIGQMMAGAILGDVDAALDMSSGDQPQIDRDTMATPEVRAMMRRTLTEAMRQGGDAYVVEMIMFVQPWGFDLADITVPVRMWHGGVDVNVPLSHAHHLAANMPTATLTVLPEHGHMSLAVSATTVLHELFPPDR